TGCVRPALLLALLAALQGLGCDVVEGGASDDLQRTGRQDRGRDMGGFWAWEGRDEAGKTTWEYLTFYSQVVLSPDGRFILAMAGVPGPGQGWDAPGRVLVVQPLPVGKPRVVPEIRSADRINFSPDGHTAWILAEDAHEVVALDLESFSVKHVYPLGKRYRSVDVTPDGQYLVLSNLPLGDLEEAAYDGDAACWDGGSHCNRCALALVETSTGKVVHRVFGHRLRDLDYHRPTRRLLVTWGSFDWVEDRNETTVEFLDARSALVEASILFPNCADELVLLPDGSRGLLAPTHCLKKSELASQDPISVIDLETRSFVKNLPGFGPVTVTPDGAVAVGFTRREVMEEEWDFHLQQQPVGFIVVDTATLAWRVLDYGTKMPVFTVSPDGSALFVHEEGNSTGDDAEDQGWDYEAPFFHDFARVDLADFSRTVIQEVGLGLERYAWSPDGARLYGLCQGAVFAVDVASGELGTVEWMGHELMALRPQGDLLLLASDDAPEYFALETQGLSLVKVYDLSL
ncbi:MAG: hypothetical protein FJ098_16380, partial [Deltaproteobacteria bacterium]|nr:hypothetical protein [Deltaproteobacteria bacterium]